MHLFFYNIFIVNFDLLMIFTPAIDLLLFKLPLNYSMAKILKLWVYNLQPELLIIIDGWCSLL